MVVGGRVFVGTLRGPHLFPRAAKGCLDWSVKIASGVRSAMTVGMLHGSKPARSALYFGNISGDVHVMDTDTGKALWTARANDHSMTRLTGA
jgi:outer membrane protein assembly factor BamB